MIEKIQYVEFDVSKDTGAAGWCWMDSSVPGEVERVEVCS